ncbi:hypothetical protein [Pararhodobacter sp. SW119]|uniref:hypothetical protein n=1 Tax=Pararhodobacter sp. SW119 TaxID=2780075 RepID=UPI001ADED749|nr:hypothetical protein [Pararhodobacter sp. SW119]
MPTMSPPELEGRLNGQREVLAVLLAQMMAQAGDDTARRIESLLEISDHQEDPGAVPDPAFAIEAASALEVRLLLERARAIQESG